MTIQEFAAEVERQKREQYAKDYPGRNMRVMIDRDCTVHIHPGRKYTKVDVGHSGAYMIDADGNIFGIKAYGHIHRGHQYGTLDTVNEWYWGDYNPRLINK